MGRQRDAADCSVPFELNNYEIFINCLRFLDFENQKIKIRKEIVEWEDIHVITLQC